VHSVTSLVDIGRGVEGTLIGPEFGGQGFFSVYEDDTSGSLTGANLFRQVLNALEKP